MDAHVPVCALFKGRIVDHPEHLRPQTPETSGDWVKHEVYMIGGIILIVIELKLRFQNLEDHTAQLLLELVSTYKVDAGKEFDKQPPVYAMLTDLDDFYIFRYDGSIFSLHQDEITVLKRPRSAFMYGIINVTEILFSATFWKVIFRSWRQCPQDRRPGGLSFKTQLGSGWGTPDDEFFETQDFTG